MGRLVLLLVICAVILASNPVLVRCDEVMVPIGQGSTSSGGSSATGKFHLNVLDRPFKNRHLRSDYFLEEMRRAINTHPRVLEVVDLQLDDGDVIDGNNNKRFDDYGHSRFGKRNEIDDYGHSRFGK